MALHSLEEDDEEGVKKTSSNEDDWWTTALSPSNSPSEDEQLKVDGAVVLVKLDSMEDVLALPEYDEPMEGKAAYQDFISHWSL